VVADPSFAKPAQRSEVSHSLPSIAPFQRVALREIAGWGSVETSALFEKRTVWDTEKKAVSKNTDRFMVIESWKNKSKASLDYELQ
jgi:hypothetical protein